MDIFKRRLKQIYFLVNQFCLNEYPNGVYPSGVMKFLAEIFRLYGREIQINSHRHIALTKKEAANFLEISMRDLLMYIRDNQHDIELLHRFDDTEWIDVFGIGTSSSEESD